MKKIKKTIKAIFAIIKNPWLLNLVLIDNSVRQKNIIKKYNLTSGLPQIQFSELFKNFSENLHTISFLGGGSLPTDMALLRSLCKKVDNCSYFEIGTWRGESVKNLSDVTKECYTLNLSKQEIIDLGLGREYANAHAYFSKNLKNVTHLEGNSLSFDYAGLNKKFDVIFIDGNHHYEYVKSDTQNVFEHLLKPDSVVVWNDYAYHPENVRFEILEGILDGVPKKFHKNLYHVANTMCAIFIQGDYQTNQLVTPVLPKTVFEVELKTRNFTSIETECK